MNTFKPRFTIANTGDAPLSDYHAELYFRVPQGKTLAIPTPDDWYTPEAVPSAKNIGGTVWKLDLHFDKHILYPADSVSEGNIGLHLTDWSSFDKTVCGVVLRAEDGTVLSGKEPTVQECESYSELPMYSGFMGLLKKQQSINANAVSVADLASNKLNFANRSAISFSLAETGEAELSILNVKGATVWKKSLGNLPAGANSVSWDGAGLPAGSYNLMLKSGSKAQAFKFGLR